MNIFTKFLITLLVVSLLPLSISTFFTYNRFSKLAIKEEIRALSEILDARLDYLHLYFEEMENHANLMAHSADISSALNTFSAIAAKDGINSSEYKNASENIRKFFSFFIESFEIGDTYLIDKEGNVIYSFFENADLGTNLKTGQYKDTELGRLFSNIQASFEGGISGFQPYPVTNEPGIFVGAPVFSNNQFLGVFAFQIPPTEIYKIFQDYTFLKDTGEVLIASREGDNLVFVNPIRHSPNSAFKLKLSMGSERALPTQQAVQRAAGKGSSIDYREKKVLAVWDFFPKLDWGIVVKIDLKEALAPIAYLRTLMIILGVATTFLAVCLSVFIAKSLSKPIILLKKMATDVGEGNLETTVDIRSKDELGDLAKAFSQMIQQLKESTTSIEHLNQEIEERKKTEQIKTELLSRVSHELRTPLAPIKEGIQLAIEDPEGTVSSKQHELLELAIHNVDRLLLLINNILSIEKMSAGKLEFFFQKENINELVKKSVQQQENDALSKKLSLKMELADNLPEVSLDKNQISLVLANLLSNAIKFTDSGQVLIKTTQLENEIQVSIQDTGIGISEDDLSKLFQSFRELKMKNFERKQGMGLGLASCRLVIETHHGRIWAESTLNKGTTFYFTLPIEKGK